jgi:hypothetical protein
VKALLKHKYLNINFLKSKRKIPDVEHIQTRVAKNSRGKITIYGSTLQTERPNYHLGLLINKLKGEKEVVVVAKNLSIIQKLSKLEREDVKEINMHGKDNEQLEPLKSKVFELSNKHLGAKLGAKHCVEINY